MLPNYLKLAFRQLWRNRLFTALNVLGLSIGLAACWMIFQLVNYEFSFDADQPNRDRIYKVVTHTTYDGKESGSPGVPMAMADALNDQMSGIEMIVEQYYQSISEVQVPQAPGKPLVFAGRSQVVATTADYFQLVPYQWLAGTPAKALAEPNEAVLTLSRAEKYFPNLKPEQMLGKTILYRDTVGIEVTGVIPESAYHPVSTDAGTSRTSERKIWPEYLFVAQKPDCVSIRDCPNVRDWRDYHEPAIALHNGKRPGFRPGGGAYFSGAL